MTHPDSIIGGIILEVHELADLDDLTTAFYDAM